MKIMNDQRTTLLGLSKGNWIVISIFILSCFFGSIAWTVTYGQTLQQVEVNTRNIEKVPAQIANVKKELKEEIKESEGRILTEIKASENRAVDRQEQTLNHIRDIINIKEGKHLRRD